MKHTLYAGRAILAALAIFAAGCTGADLWDSVPSEARNFIDRYYPNSELSAYEKGKDSYTVELKDGPGFIFDSTNSWTSISGNGMPLKEVLIYDEAPGKLYDYLETIEETDGVFDMTRNSMTYTVTLLDSEIVYTIASGDVSGAQAPVE